MLSLVQQLGSERHRCSAMTAVLRSTAAGSEALSSRRQLPDQRLILLAAAIYDCSPLCSGALFVFCVLDDLLAAGVYPSCVRSLDELATFNISEV